ncbi:TPR end-of-group domain-containing protein [Marinicella meishanensis]|uniref:TPR end-of-group domain-containing protein n=1 Tax=Marinicella meishanensis TaxID=2873263 RepID=UPI001CC08C22|nr:S41 family peptidase [Marinicella sp. NBU2979]
MKKPFNDLALIVMLAWLSGTGFAKATLLETAEQAYFNENWPAAINAYEVLTQASPYHGDFFYRLGRAYFYSDDLANAQINFQRALQYGISSNSGHAHYYLAKIAAKQDDKSMAYLHLSQGIDLSPNYINIALQDPIFAQLRPQKQFAEMLGIDQATTKDPVSGWRNDLLFLKNRFERSHHDLFHHTTEAEWNQKIKTLYDQIPGKSLSEVLLEFQKIGALAMDSHSYATPLFGMKLEHPYHMLPLEFYFFGDDLFIRAAHPKYHNLVGHKVVKVGDKNVAAVAEIFRSEPLVGLDNAFQFKWQLPWFLRVPEVLHGVGVTPAVDRVALTVEDESNQIKEVTIEAQEPLDMMNLMSSVAADDWVHMNAQAKNPKPLFLKHPEQTFWKTHLDKDQIMYMQINNMRDQADQTLAQFTEAFLADAQQLEAQAVVIDVRLNNGGNANVARNLVKNLLKSPYNRPNRLFIIIGRNTFSATMPPIAALDKWSDAIFVGEPTGTRPNFIAEGNMFRLPYSGVVASVSNNYWQGGFNSQDSRLWIAPELGAEPNALDFQNNIDPAMQRIQHHLSSMKH